MVLIQIFLEIQVNILLLFTNIEKNNHDLSEDTKSDLNIFRRNPFKVHLIDISKSEFTPGHFVLFAPLIINSLNFMNNINANE